MQDKRADERHKRGLVRDGDIGSVARAVAVLDTLAVAETALGVSELARRCNLPKSSVQRMLKALYEQQLLEREGTRYRLGLKLFELGQHVPRQRSLREAARPFMADLREATGHAVHLAVLDNHDVVYLEVLRSATAPPLPTRMGGRWPAHGTGIGKAILAYADHLVVEEVVAAGLPKLSERTISNPGLFTAELARIRERGVAYDLEESRAGVVCVASPVHGMNGEVVAGLSVSGWHNRINLDHAAAAVRTAALGLSRQMSMRSD
ncbi:IclR family transcriptional regulator [Rhodococcus pyridinivorans KG-16]|uniref:Glycerol operon regulatory protein n=1 Tax=Rhodococcus pyridinivorans KG-16 TaxID=1441730 RepID=A0A0V9UEZ8_9NOCA|nr:IclR family transcriptional regulator [Rhodococcus pyridinivorans]KSZ56597.1 IclR family transcriptional regulator [Rhodococcus pyridinivorans KG-16]